MRRMELLRNKAGLAGILPEAARDLDAFYQRRAVEPSEGPILVAAIDCKGIPMVKPERTRPVARLTKGQKANRNGWRQWLVDLLEGLR